MIDVAKDELIDHTKARKALGNISYQTFMEYVRSGDLEAVKNRGSWFTTYAAINTYMRSEDKQEIDRTAAKSSAIAAASGQAVSRQQNKKAKSRKSPGQQAAIENLRALGLM